MKNTLDLAKTGFEVLKQLLIAVVLLFLIFYPAGIGYALDRIGISEGDLWGLKWKKELKQAEKDLKVTDDVLQQAQADKDKLAAQLQLANDTIEKQNGLIALLQSHAPAATPAPEVSRVVNASKELIGQNQQAISDTQKNIQAAQQVIVANSQRLAPTRSGWLVLAGADTSEADAMNELRKARGAGFDKVKVFKNRGMYRTAIVYDDRQDAADALVSVKAKVRDSAYIVAQDKWCPNPTNVSATLIDCGT
jgi:SPOR domain